MNTKNIIRTLFMAVLLLVGASSAKAIDLWTGNVVGGYCPTWYSGDDGSILIPYSVFETNGATEGSKVRIYATLNNDGSEGRWKLYLATSYYESLGLSDWPTDTGDNQYDYHSTTNYDSSKGYFTITFGENTMAKIRDRGGNMMINFLGLTVTCVELVTADAGDPKPSPITIDENIANGYVSVDVEEAYEDEEVTITAIAMKGYKLKHFLVNGSIVESSGNAEEQEDGTTIYTGTFKMLGRAVTISAEFINKNIIWQGNEGEVTIPASEFVGVSADAILRVWGPKEVIKVQVVGGEYLFHSQYQQVVQNDDLDEYYNSDEGYFEFILTEEMLEKLANNGLYLQLNYGNSKITQVMLIPGIAAPKHNLVINIDGVETEKQVAEGADLSKVLPTPTKEGYTFEGWEGMPDDGLMPTDDLTVTAVFTINQYKLIYLLDGEVYLEETYDYGSAITPIGAPDSDDGYTFSGWSEIPSYMPAHDVTVTGSFTKAPVSVEIGPTGYATFCSAENLDFRKVTGVKAYYAKEVSDGVVTLVQVTGTVAAGTGLVLVGDEGKYSIPVASSGNSISGNLLVGVSTDTNVKDANKYVLTVENGVVKFASTANQTASVPAGHAYLDLSRASSRAYSRIVVTFSGETTGIADRTLIDQEANVYYDLRGMRVEKPTHGLYIINGKKVFVK